MPRALSFSDRLLVVDDGIDALLQVDPVTGDRTLILTGLSSPSGVAHDVARERALITDTALDALLAVDLGSGQMTPLSGTGPLLLSPEAVAVAADLILVIDSGLGALVAIEPTSGDRVIVSK